MRRAVSSRVARRHLKKYLVPGMVVERAEHAKGAHLKVWLSGVPTPQIVSLNDQGRDLKNAQARIRRLAQSVAENRKANS